MGFLKFLTYNNAVPIAFSLLILGAGGALAANEDVQKAVIDSQEVLKSVDNTYIVSKDFSTWQPIIQVTSVTEDDTDYFVEYSLTSIALEDAVWRDITKKGTLKVNKDLLRGRDLGLHVSEQLTELAQRELALLKETQQFEKKKGESRKVVAIEYTGLLGKYLDPKEEVIEGYTPVIPEPEPGPVEAPATVAAVAGSTDGNLTPNPNAGSTETSSSTPSTPVSTGPLVMTLNGDNPFYVAVGAAFTDPGVSVSGGTGSYTNKTFINGWEQTVSASTIDTSAGNTYIITYEATDTAGTKAIKTRTVIVTNTAEPSGDTGTTTSPTSGDTSTTTPSTPADTTPPTVTLSGSASMQLTIGDVWTDPGATASDATDGSVSVTTSGTVDTATAGTYTLTYSATDAAGNTGSAARTVTVVAATPPPDTSSSTTTATSTSP